MILKHQLEAGLIRKRKMKLICKECESELEFTDLHEDGTELMVKPCKECLEVTFDNGYDAGLENCGCTEADYDEGYKEGHADAKSEADDEIAELKEQIE
jgi:hypothetical protein